MAQGDPDLERISGSDPLPAALEPARPKSTVAWEPVTPRGVAAFAPARWARYLLVASGVALFAAVTVVWFVAIAWAPIAFAAMGQLPDTGHIEDQQLTTPHRSPEPLAINSFLGFGVDVDARSNANVGTDIYVKFQRTEVLLCSFLGCTSFPYPVGWTIQFNRPELEPWWGAWKTSLVVLLFLGTGSLLMCSWLLLGILYTPIVWLVARLHGRKLAAGACWRLGSAVNLPGALLLTLVIGAYGIGLLGIIPFCVLALGHFVPAWVYLFVCPRHIPVTRKITHGPDNPFGRGTQSAVKPKGENIFRRST